MSLTYEVRIRSNDSYYQHYDYFSKQEIQPNVLIFGDSRGVYGLRNAILGEGIFNYSYFAENYSTHYLRLLDAIEKKKPIKAILIPLDLHSIGEHRNQKSYGKALYFSDLTNIRKQFPKRHRLDDLQSNIESFFPILNRAEFTMLVKTLSYDLIDLIKGKQRERERGFDKHLDLTVPHFSDWSKLTADEQKMRSRSNAKRKLANKGFSAQVYKAQKDLIELAKNNGIQVYGLKFPVRPEYDEAANEYADSKIITAYQQLGLDAVIDFKETFFDRPEYFEDSDHLNQTGAEHFSKLLKERIDSKVLAENKQSPS